MNRVERTLNTHATNETTRNDGTALREALRELGTTIRTPGAERDRAINEINRRL